ncbi:MFS transporter [uncultured Limosilactobacillus sp.]|uniref:MFS transporter n=1 Tax=uncultured Limosilactobacillus sp. TaxID=2837629 RepID=UPI002598D5E2|nr:MFS transporter [uncultured Limosilactobacillus sp.]
MLSLYIATLGHFSHQQLNFFSGLAFSAMYFVSAFISPVWGRLADRYGHKPMCLRAALGMAIVLGAMGLVTNVWQLIGLRMAQGVFAGFISNSNALIPQGKEWWRYRGNGRWGDRWKLAWAFLGGTLSSIFSYRTTFFITGGILLLVFLGTLFLVHEEGFVPVKPTPGQPNSGVLNQLALPRVILGLLVTTLIIQAANNSINPIVSLFIRQLMHNG